MFRTATGVQMSYEEVARRVCATSVQLSKSGLGDGDRMIAYCEDTIPLAMLYLACGQIGVLVGPLSPVFSKAYLRNVVRQAGANAIFTLPELVSSVADLKLPLYCPRDPAPPTGAGAERTHRLFGEQMSLERTLQTLENSAVAYQVDDSFLIQPTSGSTGSAKLVLRTFMAFSRYAEFVGDEVRKATKDEPFDLLAVNALTHAFAGHMTTMGIRLGATFCVPPALDAATKLESVRALDPHVLPMTPRVLRSFVRQHESIDPQRTTPLFGPSAKLLLSAGGKGDVGTFKRLRNDSIEVCEFYGSSEASIVALTPYGEWQEDCAGYPAKDVKLDFGRDNEILVQSPGLFIGYLGDTEFTNLVFNEDLYYKTGDVGKIREDGRLQILGRKRDIFSTPEGTNIFPERIEVRLESLRWVQQAMLVGDGRPYITAHIMLRGQSVISNAADGAVEPNESDVYHFAASELAQMNEELEFIEQILAFFLYCKPLDTRAYELVSAGKVRRSRASFLEIYAERVDKLYSPELPQSSPHVVPPGERRYIDRTTRSRRK